MTAIVGGRDMAGGTNGRVTTGIEGLDELLDGGLVPGTSVMVEGAPGTGKSVLAMQYILAGIERGEPGIYVSLEETPERIYRDAGSFGWDFRALERENKLRVVATSAAALRDQVIGGAAFRDMVAEIGARRAVMDSITMLQTVCNSPMDFRATLATMIRGFEAEGLQLLLVRDEEASPAGDTCGFWSRYTVDTLLRLETEFMHGRIIRRLIRVVKTRGQGHVGGKHAYAILDDGISVFARILPPPVEVAEMPSARKGSGVPGLDEMLGGGYLSERIAMISGPSGSGKTLLMLNYLADGARHGEHGLLMTTEQSRVEMTALAAGIGLDLEGFMSEGMLDVLCLHEMEFALDEVLYCLRKKLSGKRYARAAIDSLNSLGRIAAQPEFAIDGMVYVVELLERMRVTSLLGYESPVIAGQMDISRAGISGLASTVLLTRLVEIDGDVRKGILVLKHRGSPHATEVRQLIVDEQGMRVHPGFEGYQGALIGVPQTASHPGLSAAA